MKIQSSVKKEITFKANIFRFLIDTKKKHLIAEIRDGESFDVSFSLVNLTTNELIWSDVQLPENWWLGMAAIANGILVLYTYPNIEKPEPKGLIVFDTASKKIRWRSQDKVFYDFSLHDSQELIVYNKKESELIYEKLNILSGASIEILKDKPMFQQIEVEKNIWYPLEYPEENIHYPTFKKFLNTRIGVEILDSVLYLEYKNKILMMYYQMEEEKKIPHLLVMGETGEEIYSEQLEERELSNHVNSFLVYDNQLIYLKTKQTLVIYPI